MEESNNKYILQWRELVLKAAKALEEKNFDLYDTLMNEANAAYDEYKRDSALTYECTNFGMANYIFEPSIRPISHQVGQPAKGCPLTKHFYLPSSHSSKFSMLNKFLLYDSSVHLQA